MTLFIIQISRGSCCFHPRAPIFPSVPYLQIPAACLPLISTTKLHVHTKQSVGRITPVVYPNLHHHPNTNFAYQWPLASDSHFMLQNTLNHRPTSRRNSAEKMYTDDPKVGLDRSATARGRDSDIRFYEHLLTGSHEQTSQFIIHYQFFLNSLNHEKWFKGTEKWQIFPELTVDSDSSAVERNTLYVMPIDLVWSSTQKMRFHLPHWILSVLPYGNPPPYSRQKLYYCSLLWKIQHSSGQFALWRQTIWQVWLIFQTKARVLCNKNARSTVQSRQLRTAMQLNQIAGRGKHRAVWSNNGRGWHCSCSAQREAPAQSGTLLSKGLT